MQQANLLQRACDNEMYCHDQKVMGSNPGRVNLGVRSTSVQVILKPILFIPFQTIFSRMCLNQAYLVV